MWGERRLSGRFGGRLRRTHCRLAVIVLVLLSPWLTRIAYAYLDPGTGSYLLQLIVGTLLGGLFAIGLFWKRVVAFVKRLFGREKDGNNPKH